MSRTTSLAAALVLIALPVALVVVEAGTFLYANRHLRTIVSSGEEREYLLHVPPSYDGTTPTPLVISLHGAGGPPAGQMATSQWNTLADEHGFIVVYPSGLAGNGPRIWNVNRGTGLKADVTFIADLIDALKAAHNIDPTRIYADGLSNGGGMAFVLSCTLSDRIAAVGLVASAQSLPWSWCTSSQPVPMIAIHGTADPITPYQGGASPIDGTPFPGIATWAANWARRNQCGASPVEAVVAADVTRREYQHCAGNAAVVLYTVQGGGHTWPGGGPLPEWFVGSTTRSIDASALMWAFFSQHPLAPR